MSMFPEEKPYSLRIDVPQLFQDALVIDQIHEWAHNRIEDFKFYSSVNVNSILHYICAIEISKNKKYHLQCIVWFSKELTTNEVNKVRNWWRVRAANTYQPVSFKRSVKPDSLQSYVTKDYIGMLHTNLSTNQQSLISKWRDSLGEIKLNKREEFNKKVNEYMKDNPFPDPDTIANQILISEQLSYESRKNSVIKQYLTKISSIYYDVYKSPMRRMIGLSALINHGIVHHHEYIESLYGNFFRV